MKKILPLLTLTALLGMYGCHSDTKPKVEAVPQHTETIEDKNQREKERIRKFEKTIDSVSTERIRTYDNILEGRVNTPNAVAYDKVAGIIPQYNGERALYLSDRSAPLKQKIDNYSEGEEKRIMHINPIHYNYNGQLTLRMYIDPAIMDTATNKTLKVNTEGWSRDEVNPETWIKRVNAMSEIDTSKQKYTLRVDLGNKIMIYDCSIKNDFEIETISVVQGNKKNKYQFKDLDPNLQIEQERVFGNYQSALDRAVETEIINDLK